MAYIGPFREGWRAQVQRDGQRLTKTFRTKREAQAWATEHEAKKTPLRANTLRQAIDRYLETVSVQKRNAVDWERRRFDSLAAYLGEKTPLSEIDSNRLGEWRDWRMKTVSGSTVMREVNLFRNLFSIAKREWKWISVSPFEGVRLPKENLPRQAIWRAPDIWKIHFHGRRKGGKTWEVVQAFHIALRTGLRLQEALAAPAGFDRKRRVITIPPSKTNPRPEDVPLTKEAYRLMLKMKPFTVGANEASVLFSELCRERGIKGLQFRDSRATALTLMSRRMDVLTLARISRHKDLRMISEVYYRESADAISARL